MTEPDESVESAPQVLLSIGKKLAKVCAWAFLTMQLPVVATYLALDYLSVPGTIGSPVLILVALGGMGIFMGGGGAAPEVENAN